MTSHQYSRYKLLEASLNKDKTSVLNVRNLTAESILNLNYFDNWLVGFAEAESCFSIRKNGYHSFSISQVNDSYLIEAVKLKFNLTNKIREIYLDSGKTLYSIETYKREKLLDIIEFFDRPDLAKFKGEKLISYIKFKEQLK